MGWNCPIYQEKKTVWNVSHISALLSSTKCVFAFAATYTQQNISARLSFIFISIFNFSPAMTDTPSPNPSTTEATIVPTFILPATSRVGRAWKKRKISSNVWSYVKNDCEGNAYYQKCLAYFIRFSINSSILKLNTNFHTHGFFLEGDTQQSFEHEGALVAQTPPPNWYNQDYFENIPISCIVQSLLPFSFTKRDTEKRFFKGINPGFSVPSRLTTHHRVMDMKADLKAKMRLIMSPRKGKVSLTADSRSSKMFWGYMIITAHWIDAKRCLLSATLEFIPFYTPLIADAVCASLCDMIKSWNLGKDAQFVATDNASDIVKEM